MEAVVLTGHEVPTLLGATNHITWCTSGTTYELGPPVAAAANPASRREYLGSALTRPNPSLRTRV
jgi:ABC-type lipopolysaccharide export system ATPase subunit